jgi:glycosyltransferase involved in cell wall biosynthesis
METIAYLVNTFLRKSEWFIYDQVRAIKNFQVEVLAREYINREIFPYDRVNYLFKTSSLKEYYSLLKYTLFCDVYYFSEVINRKNIKLIHAHFGPNGVWGLEVKRKNKLPLIITFHGHDITRLPKFVFYPPAWFHYFLKFEDLKKETELFLAVSNFIAKKLVEKGFPKEKIKTHYLGIKIEKYEISKTKEKIILTVGRLVEKKGTEYLIRAMVKIKEKIPNAILYICGDGPLKNYLLKLTKELRLEKNVLFLGWQKREDVFKLMQKSAVFVLPSITAKDGDAEGLPTVILEAMLHQLPAVGSMIDGISEAVIDKETGFLVPERDVDQLAEKILILLQDLSLAEKMGKKGRQFVEEKFNLDKQIKKLESIYREFL